ncbi:MAG TPA: efflux RND transporter periplasmic adaptor subunit, partial [Phycisphaerales bacterium]|nr:efflux RND transporter periplasmic adaptor subunit [Phycisphaerales bacterium]
FDSDRFTIYAPIGGVVTHLGVREGDYVKTGAPIATVADLSRLWIDMQAYESQLPLLRWGQRVTFTVEAHPGEQFHGRISFIEPIVDEKTRTAAVRVAVENPNGRLKPGMFASAVVHAKVGLAGALPVEDLSGEWVCPMHPTQTSRSNDPCPVCGMDMVPASTLLGETPAENQDRPPMVIPKTAVLFTGIRSVVYVEHADDEKTTYEAREIILGPRAGDVYVVRQGLDVGEHVVVNGAFRIDSAMQIAAKPSMMSPDGDAPPAGHAGMQGTARPSGASPDPAGGVFSRQLTPVYDAYLGAQRALAGDDLDAFNNSAVSLNDALADVRETGIVGDAVKAWRRAMALLRTKGGHPAAIDEARARFERMSEGIITLLGEFGPPEGETLNLAHCPMAFDFKGADWVQRGEEIRNPYFGSEMLACGSIKRSFKPNSVPNEGGPGHE